MNELTELKALAVELRRLADLLEAPDCPIFRVKHEVAIDADAASRETWLVIEEAVPDWKNEDRRTIGSRELEAKLA